MKTEKGERTGENGNDNGKTARDVGFVDRDKDELQLSEGEDGGKRNQTGKPEKRKPGIGERGKGAGKGDGGAGGTLGPSAASKGRGCARALQGACQVTLHGTGGREPTISGGGLESGGAEHPPDGAQGGPTSGMGEVVDPRPSHAVAPRGARLGRGSAEMAVGTALAGLWGEAGARASREKGRRKGDGQEAKEKAQKAPGEAGQATAGAGAKRERRKAMKKRAKDDPIAKALEEEKVDKVLDKAKEGAGKKKEELKPCVCGCGGSNKNGGAFAPGHDGRVHGWFLAVKRGDFLLEGLRTKQLQEAFGKWDGTSKVRQAFA